MRSLYFLLVTAFSLFSSVSFADPLSDLASSSGNNVSALITVGDLMIEAGRVSEAKKIYKLANAKGKDNPEVKLGSIKLSMAETKFQQIKYNCRKLTQAFPKSSVGDICSGLFWLANDRSSRAIEDFEKAADKGDIIRGKIGIGDSLSLVGKWDEAIVAYKQALEAGAGYQAHLGLGLTLEKLGNVSEAVESLKQAVSLQPASCLSRYNYGRLLSQGDTAISELSAAVSIRPKWFDAYFALAEVYENSGDFEKALSFYQKAIDTDNTRAPAHFGAAKCLRALKKDNEALTTLNQVITLLPNHAGAYLLLAEIYNDQNNVDKAIESLDRAREVASGDVRVFVRSGEIYYHAGRHTNARAFLNQALTMNPKLSKAHALLGEIACERLQFEEGRKHFDSALSGDLEGVDKALLTKKKSSCKKK